MITRTPPQYLVINGFNNHQILNVFQNMPKPMNQHRQLAPVKK